MYDLNVVQYTGNSRNKLKINIPQRAIKFLSNIGKALSIIITHKGYTKPNKCNSDKNLKRLSIAELI